MALKDTIKTMHTLLDGIKRDLGKAAEKGNKAASQRVRTGTIKLEKVAKVFRKESVSAEKSGGFKRKPSAKKASSARKSAPVKRKSAKKRKK